MIILRPAALIISASARRWSSLNVAQIDSRETRGRRRKQILHSGKLRLEGFLIPDRHPRPDLDDFVVAGLRKIGKALPPVVMMPEARHTFGMRPRQSGGARDFVPSGQAQPLL